MRDGAIDVALVSRLPTAVVLTGPRRSIARGGRIARRKGSSKLRGLVGMRILRGAIVVVAHVAALEAVLRGSRSVSMVPPPASGGHGCVGEPCPSNEGRAFSPDRGTPTVPVPSEARYDEAIADATASTGRRRRGDDVPASPTIPGRLPSRESVATSTLGSALRRTTKDGPAAVPKAVTTVSPVVLATTSRHVIAPKDRDRVSCTTAAFIDPAAASRCSGGQAVALA